MLYTMLARRRFPRRSPTSACLPRFRAVVSCLGEGKKPLSVEQSFSRRFEGILDTRPYTYMFHGSVDRGTPLPLELEGRVRSIPTFTLD